MLIESVGTSLVVGKIRRGSFSNMKDAEIHKWYIFVGAFVLEFFTVYMASKGSRFFIEHILLLHFLSYIMIFTGVFFNRKSVAFKIIFIGVLLNFIVIMANGGHMPVSADAMMKVGLVDDLQAVQDGKIITHTILDGTTKLGFLGDIFILGKPDPRPKVISIGDVFLAIGVFIYIQEIMVKKRKTNKEKIAV